MTQIPRKNAENRLVAKGGRQSSSERLGVMDPRWRRVFQEETTHNITGALEYNQDKQLLRVKSAAGVADATAGTVVAQLNKLLGSLRNGDFIDG